MAPGDEQATGGSLTAPRVEGARDQAAERAPDRQPAAGAGRRRGRGGRRARGLGVLGVALFFIVWEVAGRLIDSAVILVPVSDVAVDLWEWITTGEIFPSLRASFVEFLLGFAVGTVCGIAFGIVMGLVEPVQKLMRPLVLGLYSTPTLALAPLFVIWLGYGLASKVVLIALVAVFPLLVNTETGVRQADRAYLDVARSFGASAAQVTRTVRLPAALPFVFAGMQIAVTRATVGIFVAELFGATEGIGFAITNAAAVFDTARLLSGIVVLAAFGIFMATLVSRIAVLATPWQPREERVKR